MATVSAGVKTTYRTLREAIAASGLSTEQLVARVGCTRRSVSNWRSGQRPSDFYIGQLCKALNTDIWPIYERQGPQDPLDTTAPTPSLPTSLEFHSPTGGALETAPFAQPRSSGRTTQLDPAMRLFLSEQIHQLWDRFHLASSEGAVPTLQAALAGHSHTLRLLASSPLSDADQRWLLTSQCEAEILAGRVARDQMDYAAAIAHHKQALALALHLDYADAVIASTMRLGETLTEAGLVYEAQGYCAAGTIYAVRASTRVHGEFLGFTAEVYGTLGDFRQSERLAQRAAELAVGASMLPTFGGINFSETAAAEYLAEDALRRGDVATSLAHLSRARELLVTEFHGAQNARWQAHLAIDEARIQSRAGEVEAACDALREAEKLARVVGSQITARKVQDALRELVVLHPSHSAFRVLSGELVERYSASMVRAR